MPISSAVENRNTTVREQLKEERDGVEEAIDISAASRKVYFRAWERGSPGAAADLLVNLELTKQTGDSVDGDTGKVEGDVKIETGHSRITYRFVLVNEAVEDTDTVSGYKEWVWGQEYNGSVEESPTT